MQQLVVDDHTKCLRPRAAHPTPEALSPCSTFTNTPSRTTHGSGMAASRVSNMRSRKRSSAISTVSLPAYTPHTDKRAYHEQRLDDAALNLEEWAAATFIAAATRRSHGPLS
eukprot:7377479-Prymnesium_polylepis.1